MGLFTDDERESLNQLSRSPSASQALGSQETEALQDVYWDDPDTLNETESTAIESAIMGYKSGKGPGIENDFEDDIPALFHETRSQQSQNTDESLNAQRADSWMEYVEQPDRYDWPGVDTR